MYMAKSTAHASITSLRMLRQKNLSFAEKTKGNLVQIQNNVIFQITYVWGFLIFLRPSNPLTKLSNLGYDTSLALVTHTQSLHKHYGRLPVPSSSVDRYQHFG